MISDTVPTWNGILVLKSAGSAFKTRLDAWIEAGEDASLSSELFCPETCSAAMETSAG